MSVANLQDCKYTVLLVPSVSHQVVTEFLAIFPLYNVLDKLGDKSIRFLQWGPMGKFSVSCQIQVQFCHGVRLKC